MGVSRNGPSHVYFVGVVRGVLWKSSSMLLPLVLSSGNISACEIPLPAVIHCTSP